MKESNQVKAIRKEIEKLQRIMDAVGINKTALSRELAQDMIELKKLLKAELAL